MKTKISTYEQQANDFLTKTGAKIEVSFLKHDKRFAGDKDTRDIYKCTITKGSRSYTFNFGQSIACSGEYQVKEHLRNKLWCEQTTDGRYAITAKEAKTNYRYEVAKGDIIKNLKFSAPTNYDILACLQKYDVGTFEDFCGEFGYNTDSRQAEKTYKAVLEEYKSLCTLFSDEELSEMAEIQ